MAKLKALRLKKNSMKWEFNISNELSDEGRSREKILTAE